MFAPAAVASVKRLTAQQREEWRFLKEASASSRFEAEASRLALTQSTDAGVRALAATLIKHHRSASNELEHLLHSRGMAQPMLSNEHRRTLNRLGKLRGGQFDRDFVELVGLRSQQDEVLRYEKAGLAATDPGLKAWIERSLPALRQNLASAERIAPPGSRFAKGPSTSAIPAQLSRQAIAAQQPAIRPASHASMETRSMGSAPR